MVPRIQAKLKARQITRETCCMYVDRGYFLPVRRCMRKQLSRVRSEREKEGKERRVLACENIRARLPFYVHDLLPTWVFATRWHCCKNIVVGIIMGITVGVFKSKETTKCSRWRERLGTAENGKWHAMINQTLQTGSSDPRWLDPGSCGCSACHLRLRGTYWLRFEWDG